VLQLVLYGYNRDTAPSDEAGYLAYAKSLPEKQLWEVIKDCEPLTPGAFLVGCWC
jgi:hypothetical protein